MRSFSAILQQLSGIFAALVPLLSIGCGANDNDPEYWTGSHELGGPPFHFGQPGAGATPGSGGFVSGSGGFVNGSGGFVSGSGGFVSGSGGFSATGGTVGGPASPCTVTFTLTTGPGTGRFRPKNITAMWIANVQNQLVRTLEVYAATRIINLTKWQAASGGVKADAVTGATLPNHIQHTGTWDCRDTNHNLVPDGQYQAVMEWTDDDSAIFFYPPSRQVTVPFPKGTGPQDITAPDQTGFSGIHLSLQ